MATDAHVLRGHRASVPPRRGPDPDPISDDVRRVLMAAPLADLSDAVGRLYTLDPGIAPLDATMPRALGPAVTVKLPPADNWGVHGALAVCQAGDVLVVDWRGYAGGCGTGVSSIISAVRRGLAGVVVDGGWRDIDEIAALGVPVLGRARAPFSPHKQELAEINVPVACGGVVIEPGDVIVGDRDGVVCIPRWALVDVVAALTPTSHRATLSDFDDDPLQASVVALGSDYWAAFSARGGVDANGGIR